MTEILQKKLETLSLLVVLVKWKDEKLKYKLADIKKFSNVLKNSLLTLKKDVKVTMECHIEKVSFKKGDEDLNSVESYLEDRFKTFSSIICINDFKMVPHKESRVIQTKDMNVPFVLHELGHRIGLEHSENLETGKDDDLSFMGTGKKVSLVAPQYFYIGSYIHDNIFVHSESEDEIVYELKNIEKSVSTDAKIGVVLQYAPGYHIWASYQKLKDVPCIVIHGSTGSNSFRLRAVPCESSKDLTKEVTFSRDSERSKRICVNTRIISFTEDTCKVGLVMKLTNI